MSLIAALLALALTSPIPDAPTGTVELASDLCDGQVICWFVHNRRLCTCEPDVVSFGEFDPRPAPAEWPRY